MSETYQDVAKLIDHSILQPNSTFSDFETGIDIAIAFDCASVCIIPSYLARTAERLKGTGIYACTTIGFPHGGPTTESKLFESEQALHNGAEELDIVVNIGRVKSGDWTYVENEIVQLTKLTHSNNAKIKVIFENAYLDNDEKIKLCQICSDAGTDWVKTSTGYASHGATLEDVILMREHAAPHVQVKAAGGVRDLESLQKYKLAGATRIGTSRTVELLNSWRSYLNLQPISAAVIQSTY